MSGISDLLDTYDQSGTSGTKNIGGNSIVTQQINYINALQTYLNTVNNAVNGNCITGEYRTMSFEELKGKCSTSTGTDICKSICTDLNTQGNAIISQIGGTMGAQYINFANDFSLANNPSVSGEYGNVIANSEKIQKLRSELDMKLKDLNKTPDSRFREYEDKYNYELMMNITWSILATSIIYFVFVKL
jgi:hypothetical protein